MPYSDPTQQRAYQNRWIQSRRKLWLSQNGPCVQCGSTIGLEVDHCDRSIKVTHRIWSLSVKKRQIELAKCQVLCRSCHKAKTLSEFIRHGVARYRKGCRCLTCKTSKTAQMRSYRDRLRLRVGSERGVAKGLNLGFPTGPEDGRKTRLPLSGQSANF